LTIQFSIALLLTLAVSPAFAGETSGKEAHEYEGPAVPVAPATIARDADGRVTVRAIRLNAPLRVDGRLDEVVYREYTPMSDFIQNEPLPGGAATEKTEVWVSFDEDNVYVTVRAWESEPDRMIVNEMRRDSLNIVQNENFAFAFDTFFDRRNSVVFNVNPLGGRMDGQNTNEGQYNGDWNPIWDVAVGRFDGGWTAEAAVPFKSLRYQPGKEQLWGFNVRRTNRWKNEISYLSRVADGAGPNGINRVSQAATLVGLETPSGTRTLDLKPYAVSDLTSNLTRTPRVENDLGGDVGFDAKYTLTQNLTADFTYNTDFAQVEADEQQINLTRFNQFFAEKREFFLENQGLFNFGGANTNGGGDTPTFFYSRRIGLEQGGLVPIEAGGRLTGQVGNFNLGLINIQSGGDDQRQLPGSNFTVARVRRDILRKSAVGMIFTHRSQMANGSGANDAIGFDGRWAFYQNLTFNTYWAKTNTPGRRGEDASHRLHMDYNADRYGLQLNHLRIGENFNPDIGFVRRTDMWRQWAQARFSPRPTRIKAVRKFSYEAMFSYITNGDGMVENRAHRARFGTEFQNSDKLEIDYEQGYEAFDEAFRIARGVIVPAGGYDADNMRVQWTFGEQRRVAGTWNFEKGPFYGGDRTAIGYSAARITVTPQIAVEPAFSVDRVTLPYGDFTAKLVSSRATYTVSPLMFVSGLVQYNSSNHSLGANVRFRWEYRPGSELFVVFNEGRDTTLRGFPELQNRAVVVKVNRLFRY
jgi:hypothetical protein